MRRRLVTTIAFLGALVLSAPAHAVEVVQRSNATALWFDGGQELSNAQLMITGPDGYTASLDSMRGLPAFRLQGVGPLKDGLYKYVLTAATNEEIAVDTALDNGRGDAGKATMLKPFHMYGAFRVSRGTIVTDSEAAGGSDRDE